MTLDEYVTTLTDEQRIQIMHDYNASAKHGVMPDGCTLRNACSEFAEKSGTTDVIGLIAIFIAMEVFREYAWRYVGLMD